MKKLLILFVIINGCFIATKAMDVDALISTVKDSYFESVERIVPLIHSPQSPNFTPATSIAFDILNKKIAIGFANGLVEIRSQEDSSKVNDSLQFARNKIKSIHFMPYPDTPNSIITEQASPEASVITFSQFSQAQSKENNERDIVLESPVRSISFVKDKLQILIQDTDDKLRSHHMNAENMQWETGNAIESAVQFATFYDPLTMNLAQYQKTHPHILYLFPLNEEVVCIKAKGIRIHSAAPIEQVIFNARDDGMIAIITAPHTNNECTSYNCNYEITKQVVNSRVSIWNHHSGQLLEIIKDIPETKQIVSAALNTDFMAFVFDDGTIDCHVFKKAPHLIEKSYMRTLISRSLAQLYANTDSLTIITPYSMTEGEYQNFLQEPESTRQRLIKFFNLKLPLLKKEILQERLRIFCNVTINLLLLYGIYFSVQYFFFSSK